jgi:hypothetical protein
MTQKLQSLLNLPTIPDTSPEQSAEFIEENQQIIQEVDYALDKIDAALPGVRDLDVGDAELDELADFAKEKAQDLIDLGMNVDPRFAGVILQTAGTMLGHSITAKTAKMDKKLKMIQLQLQKAKLDHQVVKDNKTQDNNAVESVEGQGIVLDRNTLLQQILSRGDNENSQH